MSEMTVSQARAALPAVLDRVADGEEVAITRHGRVVAVVVRPDVLRARRSGPGVEMAASIRDVLARSRSQPLESRGLAPARADELVAELRAERDAD